MHYSLLLLLYALLFSIINFDLFLAFFAFISIGSGQEVKWE